MGGFQLEGEGVAEGKLPRREKYFGEFVGRLKKSCIFAVCNIMGGICIKTDKRLRIRGIEQIRQNV